MSPFLLMAAGLALANVNDCRFFLGATKCLFLFLRK